MAAAAGPARGGRPETATTILGRAWDAPVAIAPLAYQTLAHPLGELATVRGTAAAARVPVVISTFAGRDLRELSGAGGPSGSRSTACANAR
nr:alpha-hydroxy-acid oxidizing protein [Actinomadura madurae]